MIRLYYYEETRTIMKASTIKKPQAVGAFLFVFCVLQPLLDVLSYWMNALGYGSGITLILRMGLLAVTWIYACILAEKKRYYWLLVGILAVLAGLHVFACVRASGICGGDYSAAAAVIDLTNFIRVAQLPIFALCFITFLRISAERGYEAIERAMMVNLAVIVVVEILSAITGTNPYTYPNKSIGLVGWFYFANSQSAILSMLVPLTICTAMKTGSRWKASVTIAVGFAVLWLFATRLTYFAIFVAAFGTLIVWAINRRLDKRVAAVILVCALICGATFTVSPMMRNRRLLAANEQKKQEEIDLLVEKGKAEFGEEDTRYLTYAYEEYLGPLVEKYGFENVVKIYNASTRMEQVANLRVKKLNYCRLMLNELPAMSRWFGLNYNDMEYRGEIYDVENDFHGIAYLYGYAGLLCLCLFFAYFGWLILWALFKNFRQYFTVEAGSCGIALCCGLIHAYETSGVLRRPNVTVYLSLLLAMVWYLVRRKEYDTKEGLLHD